MLLDAPLVSLRALEHRIGIGRRKLQEVAEAAGSYYEPFDRRKSPLRDSWRHIDNPVGDLKTVQKAIARQLFREIQLPPSLTGGLAGTSIQLNARPHLQHQVVVCLDLEDFFPSLNNERVLRVVRSQFGCSSGIASLLTKLVTFERRLPQGAATSSFVANLCMVEVVRDLCEFSATARLALTCYVDDITISGENADEGIGGVIGILSKHGLRVSRRKLSILRGHEAQVVTGVSVNRRQGVPRPTMDRYRRFINDLACAERVSELDLQRARGYVSHARALSAGQGAYLQRRLDRAPSKGQSAAASPIDRDLFPRCRSFSRSH